ncbi:MAG: P-type conjugative transfer protein TrbG [Pseudomonadota bacterium]
MRAVPITLVASAAILSGCATLSSNQAVDFKLDEEVIKPILVEPSQANLVDEQVQPRTVIVERFIPVPLPGQMKRRETGISPEATTAKPFEVIDQAHAEAKVGPKPGAYVNAIQVYAFTRGALYQIYTAPEQVTDIALRQGERLISVSAGDTERWILGDTLSGTGATERVHILVKPVESGLTTNLIITTTERVYRAELTSYRETYMAAVSWRYPREDFVSLSKGRKAVAAAGAKDRSSVTDATPPPSPKLAVDTLNFRYRINGDDPHWRPLRAFDDGHKVFIQFPRRLDQGEAPPLFLVGPKGEPQLVNYRVKGRYYVVDRLFARAELRLGETDQQVVRIERTAS